MNAHAARLLEHGKPLELQNVELPSPAEDEVLVELAYAGVNPVDRYNALGRVAPDGPLPRTLGGEAAGYVDGRPVVVTGGGLGSTRDGLFADAAVAPRECVVDVPDGVSIRDAAAVGIVGLTAWRVVETAQIGPDDRVLVLGGSGAVGLAAISYAASKGAQVWGQTGSESKADAITAMAAGVEAVVADAAGLADAVREYEPTVVIDSMGGAFTVAALAALATRGRLVLFGTSAGAEATVQLQQLYRRQLRILTYAGLIATADERREGISKTLAAIVDGSMRLQIGAEWPLSSVNEALGQLEHRTATGKVLLKLR